MKTWLVLDCHYLCYRAFHVSKELSWRGKATGVIFGFLKSITSLKDQFQTDHVIFCFEHPQLYRRHIYPSYKFKRRTQERTEEEKQAYTELYDQISLLWKRYLPKIGFRNVFCFRGMEGDDLMAKIALGRDHEELGEEVILVTADSDLYQCLGPRVQIYSPQKQMVLTQEWFEAKYGIPPRKWAVVKALCGCQSDEVEGIDGVGEVTALKYLRKELRPPSKVYQAIVSRRGRSIVRRNRKLVQLPFDGCPTPYLQEDEITKHAWLEVCNELGMRSIASHPPIATRRLRHV